MNDKLLKRITKFLLGGGAGVLLYYLALYTLTEFFGLWYMASLVIAFVLNWGTNFLIQKYWTFNNKDTQTIPKQFVLYFTMAIAFFFSGMTITYLLVEFGKMNYLFVQFLLTIIFTCISFLLTSRIFKK